MTKSDRLADDITLNAVWTDELRRSPSALVAGDDAETGA